MDTNRTMPSLSRRAYLYSALLHGALALLLVRATVNFEVERPEFYELNLGSVSSQRIEQIIEESRARTQPPTAQERIDVPERRMIEIEEPTISVPREQRLESPDLVVSADRMQVDLPEPDIPVPAVSRDIVTMDRKESFQGSRIDVGDLTGAGLETGVIGAEEAVNFTISGEIEGRRLLFNPLPAYPEGLNRNAVIRIACQVLPDGTVSSAGMVPVRKEDAALEELAMNALRLWRFASLPGGTGPVQRGEVTFIFQVE